MNRALLPLAVTAALTALTIACSDSTTPNTLPSREEPQTSKLADDAPQTTAQAEAPATTEKPAPADAGTSTSAIDCNVTTTAKDCTTCCAKNVDPRSDLKTCVCAAGSKCASACQSNVCSDKLPDLACSMCVVSAGCTFDNPVDEVKECLERSACASKPKL